MQHQQPISYRENNRCFPPLNNVADSVSVPTHFYTMNEYCIYIHFFATAAAKFKAENLSKQKFPSSFVIKLDGGGSVDGCFCSDLYHRLRFPQQEMGIFSYFVV